MSRELYWMASVGPVRQKMYSKRYWAIRSVSLASDQIISGVVMALAHIVLGIRVPLWLASAVYVLETVKDFLIMWPCIAVSRLWPITGREGMVGKTGQAMSRLDPSGIVKVENEIWKARLEAGSVEERQSVEVVSVQGLTLRVRPWKGVP